VDPDEANDWFLRLAIDLDQCDSAGGVVLTLEEFGSAL
jgi:hypothetical protein